jgi:hypothetical protein
MVSVTIRISCQCFHVAPILVPKLAPPNFGSQLMISQDENASFNDLQRLIKMCAVTVFILAVRLNSLHPSEIDFSHVKLCSA